MKLIRRFIRWFRVQSHLTALDIRVERLQREKRKSDNELQSERKRLDKTIQRFEKDFRRLQQSVDRAEGLNKKLDAALDAAREDLKTANEIVIPGLVAANETLIHRWDAESRIQAMRAVAASEQGHEK